MKLTFFSNYLNHHQLPFCLEMQKRLGDNFKFVATEEISEERLAFGYEDMNKAYDFVVRSYEDEKEAYKLGLESDVVIIGSAPTKYIKSRLKQNKLTFRYSERLFRNGFNLHLWLAVIKNYTIKERKNVYLLCSSAYSAYDFNIAGAYINKTFKWGYFPEIKKYDLDKLFKVKNKSSKIKIVWVARFLELKHPELVIELAKRLKSENYNFEITMIGNGPEFENIQNMINDYDLNNFITLTGSINNKDVRKYMEEANIFLFTSDKREGWGAVLNEAMNSACAVVANYAIGSVPFLVDNEKNGLIYKNGIDELYEKVTFLLNDREKMNNLGKKAYYAITNYWNAENAANNFLKLSSQLLKGKCEADFIKTGPCSKANIIK